MMSDPTWQRQQPVTVDINGEEMKAKEKKRKRERERVEMLFKQFINQISLRRE
jgi:hypothetical protein